MVTINANGIYTISRVNAQGRTITSSFTNQTAENVAVDDSHFTFADGENFIVSTLPALRRIQAQTAFVGITYKDLSLFGLPSSVAGTVAVELGAQRLAKQKELYGA